jgi:uncharacterized protein GlcG (DUF336 family)
MEVAPLASPNITLEQAQAWLGSTDIVLNEAFTARAFDLATAGLHDNVQPGAPLYGIGHSDQGRVISFGGGLPLIRDGEVVGAVGVSGGSVEQDVSVAEAGLGGFHG